MYGSMWGPSLCAPLVGPQVPAWGRSCETGLRTGLWGLVRRGRGSYGLESERQVVVGERAAGQAFGFVRERLDRMVCGPYEHVVALGRPKSFHYFLKKPRESKGFIYTHFGYPNYGTYPP